jgi:hypothetical protein
MRRTLPFRAGIAALVIAAGCTHGTQPDVGDDPIPEPIPVHVRNENYLDMNVFVVAGGMPRRLGQVTGNSAADFTIAWSVAYGQPISLTAVPIGGMGSVNSGALSVGPGQVVDFKIGSVLRQSMATVHDPN